MNSLPRKLLREINLEWSSLVINLYSRIFSPKMWQKNVLIFTLFIPSVFLLIVTFFCFLNSRKNWPTMPHTILGYSYVFSKQISVIRIRISRIVGKNGIRIRPFTIRIRFGNSSHVEEIFTWSLHLKVAENCIDVLSIDKHFLCEKWNMLS